MQINDDDGGRVAGIATTFGVATRQSADGIPSPQMTDLTGMHAISSLLNLNTQLIATYA